MKGYDIGSKIQARDSNSVKAKLGNKIGTIEPYTGSVRDFVLANSGGVCDGTKDRKVIGTYQPRDPDKRHIVMVDFGTYQRSMFLDTLRRYYKLAEV